MEHASSFVMIIHGHDAQYERLSDREEGAKPLRITAASRRRRKRLAAVIDER